MFRLSISLGIAFASVLDIQRGTFVVLDKRVDPSIQGRLCIASGVPEISDSGIRTVPLYFYEAASFTEITMELSQLDTPRWYLWKRRELIEGTARFVEEALVFLRSLNPEVTTTEPFVTQARLIGGLIYQKAGISGLRITSMHEHQIFLEEFFEKSRLQRDPFVTVFVQNPPRANSLLNFLNRIFRGPPLLPENPETRERAYFSKLPEPEKLLTEFNSAEDAVFTRYAAALGDLWEGIGGFTKSRRAKQIEFLTAQVEDCWAKFSSARQIVTKTENSLSEIGENHSIEDMGTILEKVLTKQKILRNVLCSDYRETNQKLQDLLAKKSDAEDADERMDEARIAAQFRSMKEKRYNEEWAVCVANPRSPAGMAYIQRRLSPELASPEQSEPAGSLIRVDRLPEPAEAAVAAEGKFGHRKFVLIFLVGSLAAFSLSRV